MTDPRRARAAFLALAALALAVLVALPTLATHAPGHSPKPDKSKTPETQVTLRGQVGATTDAEGKTTYTLSADGKTYELDAGPSWFHGDKHPLKAFVGKTVTVVGGQRQGSLAVDVETVDGTRLRAAGKPPWAGGWKKVGKAHPGWSQEKADRMKAKFGDCFPPGQCKDKPNKGADGDDSPAPGPGGG
ncbi:MAG TPA: hypothetical protein VFK38_05430 [Candidatus Limnocylindrales bacterium]|nr:hypothetical protein [Candidatus Limnocylindrales bacterium]